MSKRFYAVLLLGLWVSSAGFVRLEAAEGSAGWSKVYQGSNVTSLFIQDDHNLWAVGENAIILHSKDAGRTWEKSFEGGSGVLNAIYMIDQNSGWAVGAGGAIFATTDGGKKWERRQGVGGGDYHCVHFTDATHGLIGGSAGMMLVTEDGGKQWKGQQFKFPPPAPDAPVPANAIRLVGFSDASHAVLLKDNDRVMITDNGGKGWKFAGFPEGFSLEELHVRGNSAWVGGGRKLGSGTVVTSLWFSSDAGKTWRAVNFAKLMVKSVDSLWFADDQNGLIAVDGKLYRTRDGGQNWALVYEGPEHVGHIFARDLEHVWAVMGGSIYHLEPNRSAASQSQ